MDTAREKAIRLLLELFELDHAMKLTPDHVGLVIDAIDAIIEAARAPESTHTRAVTEAT